MGKNAFIYETWLADEFNHDYVFLHPGLLDDKIASFAALVAQSLFKNIYVLSEPLEKDMTIYYNDEDHLLIVQLDDKTAINMKINPSAFGIKKRKTKKE